MKSLSGVDGAFLHLETAQTPMHVGSLHLFELPPGLTPAAFLAEVRRQMRRRLRLAPVLTRKLAPMPLQFANPVWVEDDALDWAYHVQHLTLEPPGTLAQLEVLAGRLHSELLDRHRPLWRMAVIDGLASGQVAYYFQIHHAVLDGQAGVLLSQALFDTTPKLRRVRHAAAAPAEHPGAIELAAAALRHDAAQYVKLLRHLPEVARTLAGLLGGPAGGKAEPKAGGLGQNFSFGPKTALNVPVTGERGFAAVSLPMVALKALAEAHQAKLNDIVLALCGGALRRWLAAHGGVPDKPLIATMPISLRQGGNTDFSVQATLSLVNLNTHIADPVQRLHAIRDAAGAMKSLARRARGVIPTDFPSLGTPWLLQGLAALYARSGIVEAMPPIANLVISNVPGPPVPLYAAGARMTAYWPLSIVEHGVGLNVTVMSYAGDMGFGFTTARSAVPDARELSIALVAAFDELLARSPHAIPR
jgi:WS/DGAT/MGAT family acyltransferase